MLLHHRHRLPAHILLFLLSFPLLTAASPFPNSSLHLDAHRDPDSVAREVQRKVEFSHRRALLAAGAKDQCVTGNPVDDCWRCSGSDWRQDRQRLADCGIGFGRDALGGKGGPIYVVTDPSDRDPVNPAAGTLRYGAIQEGPLWITFARDMTIRLNEELLVNSFKTIDGRGAVVHIAGGACITLQYVSNIIIHNVHVHHCVPAGEANVRSSPTHYGWRTRSDGDGISIYSGRKIWVDHCALSYCADGLIDAVMGSTGITISNNHFSHHNEVMLLGHNDDYLPDSGMQVTIAFNRFGEELVQRMPRCRRGYFHVVNNDFTAWQMYAIGGSANPTINSQGNRYIAPTNPGAKEASQSKVETEESDWSGWNWRTEGDVMVNGAFFVASGQGLEAKYAKAWSVEPKSAALIDQLTGNAGVLGGPRDNSVGPGNSGVNYVGSATTQDGGEGGYGSLGANARRFIVDNQCSYSIWLGSIPSMDLGDFQVEPGTVMYNFADDGWRGRLWLRTHCTTDNHGIFSCLTGDCGSVVQSCEGKPAKAPVTLLDFLNFSGNDTQYTYGVSLMHGFNVPAMVYPQNSSCEPTGCPADINAICPSDLRVKDSAGNTIACNSACDAYRDPKLCCINEYGSRAKCQPSSQAKVFMRACPLAHTWTYDGRAFACWGSDFNITLCPKV
ncbi:unnamed protein product [Musa hybrid cultivar]